MSTPSARRPVLAAAVAAAVAVVSSGLAAGCATEAPAAVSPPATATTSSAAGVPTLGQSAGVFAHGAGFGRVKPSEIFNGGDPTGRVTRVVWASWGGAQALATGMGDYVSPGHTVAGGTEEPVAVVAFKLGTCDRRLMYQAVEWWFPRHKQAFDPSRYQDICAGSYVPGP